jgi:hypothetical protein
LVVVSVIAYTAAAIWDAALAFSPSIDAKHATAAACVMIVGFGVTLFSRRQEDFMGGPLFKGQPVLLGFAAGLWANVVLAFAGGLYPLLGVGQFIVFMGYVGSIAFIPPILVRGILLVCDRVRERAVK